MPHTRVNWVDILFVILLIRTGYVGLKSGFLPEFFRLLGLFVAFLFSFNNYTSLSRFISIYTRWGGVGLDVVSFLFVFLATLFIFKIIGIFVRVFFSGENLSRPNALVGVTLGLGRGILIAGLIYTLFVNSPFKYLASSARDKSFSGQYIVDVAPFVYEQGIKLCPLKKNNTPLVRMLEHQ
ncbi:MAG: CvpA family protein [Candidatus Gorgyraea atricola]|nr:CvpA family protein [Candidatus Gorgyraea atricola]